MGKASQSGKLKGEIEEIENGQSETLKSGHERINSERTKLWRAAATVDFDESDSGRNGRAVQGRREKGGVGAGPEIGNDDGLKAMHRRQAEPLDVFHIVALGPVVVRGQSSAVRVAHLQSRIHGLIVQPAEVSETWTEPADNDVIASDLLSHREAGDDHVVTAAGKGAGGEVGQFRVSRQVEVVDFKNANAGAAVRTAKYSRIVSRRERGYDSRLEIIAGSKAGGLDFVLLGGFPVVVNDWSEAGRTVESNRWISEESRETERAERRPQGANKNTLGSNAGNNEPTYADLVSGQDVHPRGKIHGLRGRRIDGLDGNRSVWPKRIRPFRVGVNGGARQGAKEGLQVEAVLRGEIESLTLGKARIWDGGRDRGVVIDDLSDAGEGAVVHHRGVQLSARVKKVPQGG